MTLENIARVIHFDQGQEIWTLGGDEFAYEAWEVMALGGVRVNTQLHGFAVLTLNGLTVIPWSEHRV